MGYRRSHIPNLRRVFKVIENTAPKLVEAAVAEHAQSERDRFAQRIEDQDFASFRLIFYPESGTNLSPRWLARKAEAGADDRTAIATGHYLASIRVIKRSRKGRPTEFHIGFHPNTRARDLNGNVQDVTLNKVARFIEHGTQHMPARPHWGPHLRLMRREAPKVRMFIANSVAKELGKKLRAFIKKAEQ